MRAAKQLIQSNEQLATAWWHMQMRLGEARGRETVVVYQMGKVGSSSIVASLHALREKMQVHHVHTLTPQGIAAAEAIYAQIEQETGINTYARSRHLQSSRYLAQRLHRPAPSGDRRWKVITLVREPISRNVSSFFQVIDHHLPNFVARYEAGELGIEAVTSAFLERFDHDQVLNWFDAEARPALGIDVFAGEFEQERGYTIYRGDHCDLLLLKLETLDACASAAFREFLGIEDFTLVRSNVAEEKAYATAYQQFKRTLSLPEWYLEKMYSSRYMQHFYSQAEIAAFATKWESHHAALV